MEWLAKLESKLLLAFRGVQMNLLGPVILAAALGVYFVGEQVRQLGAAAQSATAAQNATQTAQATSSRGHD